MINLYLIMPNNIGRLRNIIEKYTDINKQKVFNVTGISQNISGFYESIKDKPDFSAEMLLIIITESDSMIITYMKELGKRFPQKTFCLILPEHHENIQLEHYKGIHILRQFKINEPLKVRKIIHDLVNIFNTGEMNPCHEKKKIKKENYSMTITGNHLISILGVNQGVGVTHTIIMIANLLKDHCKVAVVEANSNNHLQELFPFENNKKNYCRYQKVDYYWGVDFLEFFTKHKDKYHVVLMDLGSYEDLYDFDEFLRADRRVVMTHGIDWKIRELKNFYNATKKYDPHDHWIYLVPFINNKYLADVKEIVDNQVISIPFNMNPFMPKEDLKKVIWDALVLSK